MNYGSEYIYEKILAVILVCIFASVVFHGRQTYATETDKNDRLNYTQHESVAGDVNADGELSISDVVLMQRWLLAVPDTELADWKAGDLCADDIIDVFLCINNSTLGVALAMMTRMRIPFLSISVCYNDYRNKENIVYQQDKWYLYQRGVYMAFSPTVTSIYQV